MPDLKTCPFCGGKADSDDYTTNKHMVFGEGWIGCRKCRVFMTYVRECDALIAKMRAFKCGEEEYDDGIETAINVCAIADAADVRPVTHGKWIVKTDSEGKICGVCSCCGYKQYAGHLKYCPECGGKMDAKSVVHGKWIKLDMHKGMEQYKCSVCQSECYVPECMGEPMYAYCPNCGADMMEDKP